MVRESVSTLLLHRTWHNGVIDKAGPPRERVAAAQQDTKAYAV
jgi:hypothetical protein